MTRSDTGGMRCASSACHCALLRAGEQAQSRVARWKGEEPPGISAQATKAGVAIDVADESCSIRDAMSQPLSQSSDDCDPSRLDGVYIQRVCGL